jgi:hypothetical protein
LLTHRCFFTFYAFGYLQVVHFPDFYLFEHGQVSHDLSFKSTYGTYDVTTIGLIFLPTFFMAVVLGMALRILKRMDKGGRESNGAGMSRMQPASLASTDRDASCVINHTTHATRAAPSRRRRRSSPQLVTPRVLQAPPRQPQVHPILASALAIGSVDARLSVTLALVGGNRFRSVV